MGKFGEAFIDLYLSNKLGSRFNVLQFENVNNDYSRAEKLVLCLIYRKGKMKMGDIASTFSLPFSTATVLVDGLVRERMLKREQSSDDRRVVYIDIDRKGVSYVDKLVSNIDNRIEEMVSVFEQHMQKSLSPAEMETFYKILEITKDFFIDTEKTTNT